MLGQLIWITLLPRKLAPHDPWDYFQPGILILQVYGLSQEDSSVPELLWALRFPKDVGSVIQSWCLSCPLNLCAACPMKPLPKRWLNCVKPRNHCMRKGNEIMIRRKSSNIYSSVSRDKTEINISRGWVDWAEPCATDCSTSCAGFFHSPPLKSLHPRLQQGDLIWQQFCQWALTEAHRSHRCLLESCLLRPGLPPW